MLGNKKPFLIVLALVAVLIVGASFIALKGKNPADERGTLTGTTVDAADNALLKGVTVTAVDQDGVHYTSHEYTDTTGSDGFFSLELPPNDYTLVFAADGYQPLESTATYKVKNGKTLEIKEDFRLVTVSSSKPENDPNSLSTAGNTSLPTEDPAMGQNTARQASATSTDSPSADGQSLPGQNTADAGNGQAPSAQASDPSSGGVQSSTQSSAMSSGIGQNVSNPPAASSGNVQNASNPSVMSSGNTQAASGENTAASGSKQLPSSQASASAGNQKPSSGQASNSSVSNKPASKQSSGSPGKGKSASEQTSTPSDSMQSAGKENAAAANDSKDRKTTVGKASESTTTEKSNTSIETDEMAGNSYYEGDNEADDGTSEANDADYIYEEDEGTETTDTPAFAYDFQELPSREEPQTEVLNEESQEESYEEQIDPDESSSPLQGEEEPSNAYMPEQEYVPEQDDIVEDNTEQVDTAQDNATVDSSQDEETDPGDTIEDSLQDEETVQDNTIDNTPQEDTADNSAQDDAPETPAPSPRTDDPAEALVHSGHRYTIFYDVKTWEEAADKCTEKNGYLAVIEDSAENEALYQYMVELGFKKVFFGLHCSEEDPVWKYCNGSVPSYFDWGVSSAEGQDPQVSNVKKGYAALDTNMIQGHWNTSSLDEQTSDPGSANASDSFSGNIAYICEWDE